MRTLDIKLATLLQTLASPPDCPKVGSMDFGERLTVVLKNVSLVAILAGHTVLMPGALLAGLASDKHRKVQSRVSQKGGRDRALSRFNVLRARKRSSERMHIALRMRMTTGRLR